MANCLYELKKENDWKILHALSFLRYQVVAIIFVSLHWENLQEIQKQYTVQIINEKDH